MAPFLKKVLILACLAALLLPPIPGWTKKGKGETLEPSKDLYKGLDLFSKVLHLVREDYVEDPEEKEMIYGAIRGMLATLDPHSLFLPADVYRELKVDTEGRFGGIGLEIALKENTLTVVTPIEGSPAAKAGIREGDRILKINGFSTKEMNLSDAVQKMRGGRGSRVTLTLFREGNKEPIEVTLRRDIIHVRSVRTEMPEEGVGYLRITSFQEGTGRELGRALDTLAKQSKDGLKGVILDLRNNPGGLLEEAVTVADLFLKSGEIVTTVSRNKEVDRRKAAEDGSEPDCPIVILVNGGTASAAEIVAGALQDHKRAVLLGTKTFGKGSVQTIFELGEGAALKLTIAKYYTPKGRSIDAEGILPNRVVDPKKTTPAEDDVQKKAAFEYLKAVKRPDAARRE